MKKQYLCALASVIGFTLSAQTLTQTNNAFVAGDTYSTLQCDSLTVSPGAAGSGATWNFSTITIHTLVVANYTAVTSSTPGYPAGSIAVASGPNDQAYYVASATDARYYGGNITVQAVTGSLTYTAPAISKVYPMSLNSTSTAVIGGSLNITSPTSLAGTFTGNSKTLADGSGTLMLPGGAGGTYTNVLRVLTTQTLNYASPPVVTGVITLVNYDYYTPTMKAPLFSISTKTITSNLTAPTTQSIVTINKNYLQVITAIAQTKNAMADVLVYPNPATGLVNFGTDNKVVKQVQVFDLTGKLIENQTFSNGSLKLDVSGYNKGIYIYQLLDTNGDSLKTGKLTVN